MSSLHLTFNTAEESNALAEVGYLQRSGIQYHWENRGYTTFEDFLADLKQSKRKNIRQVMHTLKCIWKMKLGSAVEQGL